MKIRLDFVTNSSSSSFICSQCGYETSGMDLDLSEAGMCECENGHVICEDHLLTNITIKQYVTKTLQQLILEYTEYITQYTEAYYAERLEEYKNTLNNIDTYSDKDLEDLACSYEYIYHVPVENCPLCNFISVTADDMEQYLLTKIDASKQSIINEIKSNFTTYNEFYKFINRRK